MEEDENKVRGTKGFMFMSKRGAARESSFLGAHIVTFFYCFESRRI